MTRDGFTVEYTPTRGPRRRVRFEPQAGRAGYWRITEVWNGCQWRPEGREPVSDVVCETTDQPPEIEAAKRTIRRHLNAPGATATLPELRETTIYDDLTLRAALEALHAEGRVDVEAVYWRPDRVDGRPE